MSADLERRYARLLRLYPADYRRARGAELLETLRESAEAGRRRPAPREAGALVLGALRAHAGRDRRQSARHSWLVALRAAAMMLLSYDVVDRVVTILVYRANGVSAILKPGDLALNIIAVTLGALAVGAGARGQYGAAVVTASVALTVTLALQWSMPVPVFGGFWQFPLAIILLLPLLRHRPPPAAGLVRYAPALPLLMVVVGQGLTQAFPGVSGIVDRGVVLALCVGCLIWLAVDERLAMASGLLLLNAVLVEVVFIVDGTIQRFVDIAVTLMVSGLVPAVLLVASGVAAHRRARV